MYMWEEYKENISYSYSCIVTVAILEPEGMVMRKEWEEGAGEEGEGKEGRKEEEREKEGGRGEEGGIEREG